MAHRIRDGQRAVIWRWRVRAKWDKSPWDRILRSSVSADSSADYRAIKMGGLPELDEYLSHLAAPRSPDLPEAEDKAAQINAYIK